MSVLDRAVLAVDVLGRAPGPLRLGVVAEAMGVPKSSAHRLLTELAEHGLVRRAGEGEYSLGYRLVQWGHLADRSVGLRETAEPVMIALRDEVRESVHLYVLEGDHRVCVLSVEGPHTLRPVAVLGLPMPLGYGAAGKVLYAFSDESLRQRVATAIPERRGRSVPDAEVIAQIRSSSLASSVNEVEDGVAAVATPIHARGGLLGALAVASTTTRLPLERHEELGPRLIDAATRIGRALGG